MQRGACTVSRRAVLPQPQSATCLWRADDRRGGPKRKLKPFQRYKGKKGDLPSLLSANNKWNFKWYKTYQELPEMVKREEMYIPYYNDSIKYNPNDPAELKRYLNRKRAESLREKNEAVQENKGVQLKQWFPDQRLTNNDEIMDDETDEEEEEMDEEWEEDEFDAEWRDREAPMRLAERKEYRAQRRVHLIDATKKRIIDFEKMSDADKVKKLTEYRSVIRKELLRIKEHRERVMEMSQDEVMAALKKDFGLKPEDEERLLRNAEKRPTEEQQKEFRRKYKMGEFQVQGELSGFDLFLKEKGKERLIGFVDRIMSNDPPKLPPPLDLNTVFKGEVTDSKDSKDKKDKGKKEEADAPAPGGKPGDTKTVPAAPGKQAAGGKPPPPKTDNKKPAAKK